MVEIAPPDAFRAAATQGGGLGAPQQGALPQLAASSLLQPAAERNPTVEQAIPVQTGNYWANEGPSRVAEAAGSVFDNLSAKFQDLAEKAATAEGTKAGQTAGLDPNFRPTEDNTVYGAALQKAAISTYSDNLMATTRDQISSVYNDFQQLPPDQQTPQALQGKFNELRQNLEDQHVFDEIRGPFRNAFSSSALAYINQARKDFDDHTLDQSKAAASADLNSIQNAGGHLSAMPGPQADTAIAANNAEFNAKIKENVDDGTLTAVAGQKLITSQQQAQLSNRSLALFGAAQPAARPGILKQVQDDYASAKPGFTADWSKDTYDSVTSTMQTQIRQDEAKARQGDRTSVDDIESTQKLLIAGGSLDPNAWNNLQQKYAGNTDAKVAEAMAVTSTVRQLATRWAAERPEQIEVDLNELRAQEAKQGASPMTQAVLNAGQQYLDKRRTDMAHDPIGLGMKMGIVSGIQPLDMTDPAKFAAGLQQRVTQAEHVGAELGQAPQYFLPDEKLRLESLAANGGGPMVAMAGAIARVAGPKTDDVLKSIGGQAPQFEHVAKLAALGADPQAMNDLGVYQKLSQDPAAKKGIDLAPSNDSMLKLQSVYGDALQGMDAYDAGAREAARKLYGVQALRQNLSRNSMDPTVFERSAQLAAGATYQGTQQFGGVGDYNKGFWSSGQKVLVPQDVKADQFGNVVKQITDDDLKALPSPPVAGDGKTAISARQIQGGKLVAVANGAYAVSLGDPRGADPQWVMAPDGKRFTLDLNALAPALRQRVPDAYRP